MLRDCLMWDYESLGTDWHEEFLIQRKLWALLQSPCLGIWESHKGEFNLGRSCGCLQLFCLISGMSRVRHDQALMHAWSRYSLILILHMGDWNPKKLRNLSKSVNNLLKAKHLAPTSMLSTPEPNIPFTRKETEASWAN